MEDEDRFMRLIEGCRDRNLLDSLLQDEIRGKKRPEVIKVIKNRMKEVKSERNLRVLED